MGGPDPPSKGGRDPFSKGGLGSEALFMESPEAAGMYLYHLFTIVPFTGSVASIIYLGRPVHFKGYWP